jgi:hypothetical protein
MPQLFRYRSGEVLEGVAALEARPRLAMKISMVMAQWASLEHVLAIGFAFLLGGTENSALSIYNALVDRGLRQTVYLTLAKEKLSTTLIERAEKTFSRVRTLAGSRNDVAHGQWATVSTRPNSILLISNKDAVLVLCQR